LQSIKNWFEDQLEVGKVACLRNRRRRVGYRASGSSRSAVAIELAALALMLAAEFLACSSVRVTAIPTRREPRTFNRSVSWVGFDPHGTALTISRVGGCVILRRHRRCGFDHPPILGRRSSMKYVVSWQPRSNVSEEILTRSLQVFGKWSPAEGTNYLQFLGRIDGAGGFAVVETDDPALLARDTAIFSTYFDMTVYPVLDVQEAAQIGGEALEFIRSA
jgi:hypothetical protein